MTSLRVFVVGGWLSYRALFSWLTPPLFITVLLVPAVTQLLFFTYLGRAANVESDAFFVIGNALVAASIPCIFAMSQTIADERYTQTLSTLIVSPANRVALFLGRALPVSLNGVVVAAFSLAVGSILLDVSIEARALGALALAIMVTAFSCTGLGLACAALGLRWRETAVVNNLVVYTLLIFAGVNVPLDLLPRWMAGVAQGLPVTHGAQAARASVAGDSLGEVAPDLLTELAIGAVYLIVGLSLLRIFERSARRGATLEVS